ncbi:MAG: IS1634 family transposase, partial [Firmicutes bacterium]|nr:IS1634 family transposase [Bacillota bacterium]
KSTSKIIRKLGTLAELSKRLETDRAGVMAWAKEQAKIETQNYKKEEETNTVLVPFHAKRYLDYEKQVFFKGGYLFLQYIYYSLRLDNVCTNIKRKYKFDYDLNAILSDLVYTRILDPSSKRSSYAAAMKFLEAPTYELHDIYRALSVLAEKCDHIQSEIYKNSSFIRKRNDKILYYDCSNFYFEIEQEDGIRKYGKSKEHRPNPIVQMGLFMDGDGIPLAFTLFPGNKNEQKSLKPIEEKVIKEFGCEKFIFCSDAGLASEDNRFYNHLGERSFIVTQSIKKLPLEEREWALKKSGFRCISDNKPVDITNLTKDDTNRLFYKEEPYTTKKLHQRLIVTYSPKYAEYQRTVRSRQVERAEKMVESGKAKRTRKNPNDPARFVGKNVITENGEKIKTEFFLDLEKIEEEKYDGLYAICTDLLDDDPKDILKVSEGRWQIEDCFRTMKTDFSARLVNVRREDRIKAHFLCCFIALFILRTLKKLIKENCTCDELLNTLKEINFADVGEQGFIPLYKRTKLTDELHSICGFRTDFQFIPKNKMREIQKKSKSRK